MRPVIHAGNLMKFGRNLARSAISYTSAFAPAIIAAIVVWVATNWRLKRSLTDERSIVADELATISSRLQTNLNSNVKLLQGLAAGIAVNPAMDQNGLSKLAAQVLKPDSQLRSFAGLSSLKVSSVKSPNSGQSRHLGVSGNCTLV